MAAIEQQAYLDVTIRLTRREQLAAPLLGAQDYWQNLLTRRRVDLTHVYSYWKDPATGDIIVHQVHTQAGEA